MTPAASPYYRMDLVGRQLKFCPHCPAASDRPKRLRPQRRAPRRDPTAAERAQIFTSSDPLSCNRVTDGMRWFSERELERILVSLWPVALLAVVIGCALAVLAG